MAKRRRNPRRRNLYKRGKVIWYSRWWGGERYRASTRTNDWEEAIEFRAAFERRKGIGEAGYVAREVPRFAAFAERYLEEDTSHLATTTAKDRKSHLRPGGPLLDYFGPYRLDDITAPMLREWWGTAIEARGITTKTGRNYLDSLAGVLGYARDLQLINHDPVSELRGILRRKARTKGGRAAADSGRKIHPVEDAAALYRLVEEARKRGADTLLCVLLCLDAGLRVGEALGLSWDRIGWGADDNDTSRHLLIDRNRPQGLPPEDTKSGRERKVALSRRLQRELREFYMARGRPDPSTLVLPGMDPANFRKRQWTPVTARAGITGHTPKDLRDSFASHLLTADIPLGYISKQLGHADIAITARHYARWIGDAYQQPTPLAEGEVPADLLARISKKCHEAEEKGRQAEGEATL